jgi:hypothetical protein
MKHIVTFFLLISASFCYTQDYFINEDFVKSGKVKLKIEFTPDWSKDFFIEAKIKVPEYGNPSKENVGLLFGRDNTSNKYYGIYIQNSSSQIKEYADFFLLRSESTSVLVEKNREWQRTSLINHNDFNRLQYYKIDNELFFAINDQVVAHIKDIEAKGNLLQLVAGKSGVIAKYIKANYLADNNNFDLKSQLKNQLKQYNETKIHYKIANDYHKVLDLKQPVEISKQYNAFSIYNPELNYIQAGKLFYDLETFNVLSKNDVLERDKKIVFQNKYFFTAEIIIPNQPTKTLEGYRYIDELNDSEILLIKKNRRVYAYNYNTQNFRKLFKVDKGYTQLLSKDKRYLIVGWHFYSMPDGKEIEYDIPRDNLKTLGVNCIYNDTIILRLNKSTDYKVSLKTGESKRFLKNGFFQDHYLIDINGRELNITDLTTNQQVAKNIQLLTKNPKTPGGYKIVYYPERDEVYVGQYVNLSPMYYFSFNDEVKNTSSFVVNTKTNEITPFLLYKSSSEIKKQTEEATANQAKAKQEVDQFFSQLKPFGSQYMLNYNNFDYVNVSNDSFLNKYGIYGTTYAIGKFCSYNGGSFLALGITKDQYSVELIKITYGYNGNINIRREKLGFTQKVNGVTTQVAEVFVRQDSKDKTKYKLTVDDGKVTEMKLISKCK